MLERPLRHLRVGIPGDLTQAAVVAEPDALLRSVRPEDQADVVRAFGRNKPKPSSHPGLDDDQSTAITQCEHNPLTASVDSVDQCPSTQMFKLAGRVTDEQELVEDLHLAQGLPPSAGRSPRTIVSTSGNSGMASSLIIIILKVYHIRARKPHTGPNRAIPVKNCQQALKLLDKL